MQSHKMLDLLLQYSILWQVRLPFLCNHPQLSKARRSR